MSLQKIMTRRVVTVGPDERLVTIRALFQRHGFHHLLVVDEGRLVGVISDRDLLKALSPALGTPSETTRDAATLNKRAHQVMSRALRVLKPGDSIHAAVEMFNATAGISCIPIVDAQERPVGIVSWRDVLRIWQKHNREAACPAPSSG